jgi:trehalose 6-phosphate synthase
MLGNTLSFTHRPSLFVAANRLPFSATQERSSWKFSESPGGLVSALKSVGLKMNWIGWPGSEIPQEAQTEVQAQLSHKSDCFDLHAVFLTREEKENFYNGFSNQMIWPNFHDLSQLMHYSESHWASYKEVNKKFAREIYNSLLEHEVSHPGEESLVWIHDYQLMLVPSLLRSLVSQNKKLSPIKIGFFLHIPFPCYQIFCQFPEHICKELIEGLMATDLIGVHEQSYLKNLLENIQSYSNKVRIHSDETLFYHDGRRIRLGVYPIGIEPSRFQECLKWKNGAVKAPSILSKYSSCQVILGVDRLDPSKGLVEKLEAYEKFLEDHPKARGKTVLLQIAVPSRTDIEEYRKVKENLFALADRINQRYALPGSPLPVDILYENFSVEDLALFYQAADCLLVTSLKDGMNLVSFEYTACQSPDSNKIGALVLSEMAGAARYLHGALKVNPHCREEIATAIAESLAMSHKEKESRLIANLGYVQRHTAKNWADEFIADLEADLEDSSGLAS